MFRLLPLATFFSAVSAALLGAAAAPPVLVVPGEKTALAVAVALPEGSQLKPGDAVRLVELGEPKVAVSAQVLPRASADGSSAANGGQLTALIPPADVPPDAAAARPRRFRLEPLRETVDRAGRFKFVEVDQNSLKLVEGDRPVFAYNHGLITSASVPENDHRRSRACYVHPLWGVNGEVLTDDFPKDHYHHHGVFWTWPHIGIEGKEYDLWAGDDIHDKFVRWIGRAAGPVAAVLAVENAWFVGERKVMIERVWLRAYALSADTRSLDIELTWIPVDRPIALRGAEEKSYGGLTVRFAPQSEKDAVITVPSGRTKDDLPDTRLEWADFTAKLGGAATASGAAVFVHPGHPDYPPTWLTRHYGAMCVGYPGVNPQTFQPGSPIRLCYRIWIHKDAVEADRLQQAHRGYAAAIGVKWE